MREIELEVEAEGREWTRQRLQQRPQEEAERHGEVSPLSGRRLMHRRTRPMRLRTAAGVVELQVLQGQDPADQHWGCPVREHWGLSCHQQMSLALEDNWPSPSPLPPGGSNRADTNCAAAKGNACSPRSSGSEQGRMKRGEIIRREQNYFASHLGRMNYQSLHRRGWPLGIGPVESACLQNNAGSNGPANSGRLKRCATSVR